MSKISVFKKVAIFLSFVLFVSVALIQIFITTIAAEPEGIVPAMDLFASDRTELGDAIVIANAAGVSATITLLDDIDGTHTALPINAGADVILRSEAGNNFTFTVTSQRHFNVNGTLKLENVTLSGDPTLGTAHGGVLVNAGGRLYLDPGSVIENNRASSGGGVQLDDATLTIDGGVIRGNTSTSNSANNGGGGINAVGADSEIYMLSGEISGNQALGTVNTIGGGGVRVYGGEFLMENGTISSNTITGRYGGGVAVAGGGSFTMEGGIINSNAARAGGGVNIGNVNTAATFTMYGGTISANNLTDAQPADGGGGVRLHNAASSFYMYDNSLITNHEVASDGGGVQATAGTIYLRGGIISNNRTTGNRTGAGLHVANATLTMSAGEISTNRTLGTGAAHGGGLHLVSTTFIMSSGEVSGNWTSGTGNGGGIHATGAGSSIAMSGDAAITGNRAQQGGGLNLDVTVGAGQQPFTLSSGRIEDNTARTNGGGMRLSGFAITMTGGKIHDNSAGHAGGGIHFATNMNSRLFLYEDAIISDNTSGTVTVGVIARDGGGINMTGGRAYLRGGEISGNTALGTDANAGQGGAVNLRSAPSADPPTVFTIESGMITENEAHLGGGVSIFSGTNLDVVMQNGEISYNHARNQGGGVNVNQGSFEMLDGVIKNNTSDSSGGGIRMSGNGTVELHDGEIRGNIAQSDGGGIHIGTAVGNSLYVSEDASIIGNTTHGATGGGGLNFAGGTLELHGTVSNNKSLGSGDGGGVNIINGVPGAVQTALIDGSLISGNMTNAAGGGLNIQIENFTIQNSIFANNHANSRGGGMRIGSAGNITLDTNVIFYENTTNGAGGGIFVGSSFSNTLHIHDTIVIYENSANHGGGLYMRGGNVHMHGGDIHHNTANVNGGGVTASVSMLVSPGSFTMEDGTIRYNTAGGSGGGVHAHNSNDNLIVLGGTIYDNTAHNGGGINVRNATVTIDGGIIDNNTAHNNGGGIWMANHLNPFSMTSGSLTRNSAGGDGGAIFVNPTYTDNPVADPDTIYERVQVISNSVTFDNNFAGGGGFAPPSNWSAISRFNGQLLTNHNINYRSNWRVTFVLDGGNVGGNEGPIEHIFQTDWSPAQLIIGDARVPGMLPPPALIREGYIFVGWRNRDIEPDWDEDWDGDFSDYILTWTDVAAWEVENSTEFEAIWKLRTFAFEFHKTGQDIYNVPEWNTPGWVDTVLRGGAHFSIFRYTGNGTPNSGVVTEDMITTGTWVYAGSAISSGLIGAPIEFQLLPDSYYQLVETIAPAGYTLPLGQWRVVSVERDSDGAVGFQITYQGDSTIPAFVNIGGEFEDSAFFDGTFFVGNRLQLILPLFGGSGVPLAFTLLGGFLIIMAMVALSFILWHKSKEKIKRQTPCGLS
ncbi:MAG: hypothetical protein FWE06_00130 [Oscillospiraceae bacterium]|nr:hypothetical protein [Oscillospiraceae bacterium]